jgi:small subunit ribosomal protein S8
MKLLNEAISSIINGVRVKKANVLVPNSKFIRNILQILRDQGYIKGFTENERNILVDLAYYKGSSVIKYMRFLSTASSRVYCKKINKIPRNFAVQILSTSKGVMTHMDATRANIGGQLLLEVF